MLQTDRQCSQVVRSAQADRCAGSGSGNLDSAGPLLSVFECKAASYFAGVLSPLSQSRESETCRFGRGHRFLTSIKRIVILWVRQRAWRDSSKSQTKYRKGPILLSFPSIVGVTWCHASTIKCLCTHFQFSLLEISPDLLHALFPSLAAAGLCRSGACPTASIHRASRLRPSSSRRLW